MMILILRFLKILTLQIDIKDNYLPNILGILNNLKDVMIEDIRIDKSLNIEVISENELDHQLILKGREERKTNPENYGTIDDIDWN